VTPDEKNAILFRFFNEIGIIDQLGRTMFEARMPDGMGVPQFSVLNHLVRVKDGQTPLDLARAFQTPKTSMSHTLAVLQRAGLVSMAENPDDGRSKRVFITEAGRAFRARAIGALAPDFEQLARDFDVEEIARLLPPLEAIRAYLDARRD
jgi:DNA-binding MarR family transcriptional regulator